MRRFHLVLFVLLAIGMSAQVGALEIEVPNGDFQTIVKPGTTTAATVPDGCYWSIPNQNIKGGGPATYADGTTGDSIETPGWVQGLPDSKDNSDCMIGGAWGGPDGEGDVAFLCFAGWGGPTYIQSAAPLSMPASGRGFTLSADIYHGGGPVVLELLVDGVALTPDAESTPALSNNTWVEFTRSYSTIPAGEVKILVGTRDDAGGGWTGNRASVDNITLTYEVAFNATAPVPADEATDVCTSVILEWQAGEGATLHNVYFGTDPDNWDQQSLLQSEASYDPGPLEFGTVYFWQVDEFDGATTHTGDIWQFTVEPVSYEIPGASIIATADSNDVDQGPDKTIDRSGLDEADLHSTEMTDMWVSAESGVGDPWIQYEFDREYKLDKLLVWNHNSPLESIVGMGIKDALIEYSTDGQTWQSLSAAIQFDRAPGTAGYGGATPVDLGGIVAKYVKITAQSNWGGIVRAAGLSEVRFFYVPTRARTPDPTDEAMEVAYNETLSWAPGRDAVSHDVYLSTNRKAVVDGSVAAVSIAADDICSAGYSPELALGQTYYWKVNEFDGAKTWEGDIWRFSTEEYLVVDDMTSYGDVDEIGVPKSRIWFVWRDGEGWLTPDHPAKGGNGTGSVVDRYTPENYDTPQSLWYSYDNDGTNTLGTAGKQFYSEVTANISDLPIGSDWTLAGIKSMSIYFYGDPNNIATEQLYVKLNGAKVPYDGDMAHIAEAKWHEWNIDLSLFGINLQNVTQISIGFGDENNAVARDARGIVFFDDIRLHPARCIPSLLQLPASDINSDCVTDLLDLEIVTNQWLSDGHLVTPADPGITALQARYEFEGNTNDSSGKARNGTPQGGPVFAVGQTGQALVFDGVDDYVNIDGYKGILADPGGVQQPFTLCAWIKSVSDGEIITWGTNSGGQRMTFRVDTVLRVEHGSGNVRGTNGPDLRDDQWHHVAATIPQGAAIMDVRLYVDGDDVTPNSTTTALFNLQPTADVSIGRRATNNDRFFNGMIDDARIYDRVLTIEEIAWVSGTTEPFSASFDLDADGSVNFTDICILADTWGEELLWP